MECSLWKGFVIRDSLGIRPGQNFLSVLERCPLQRMSALGRFHCKTKDAQKKKLIETQCESNVNTVAEEFVSSQKILVSQTARMLGSYIHSDDIIIVDDGWPSTFVNKLQKILKFYQRYISCMSDDSRQAYNKQKKNGDQYQLARFSSGKKKHCCLEKEKQTHQKETQIHHLLLLPSNIPPIDGSCGNRVIDQLQITNTNVNHLFAMDEEKT